MNSLFSNIDIEQSEEEFQTAWDNYWHGNQTWCKKNWDIMFMCVLAACTNLTKGLCRKRGVIIEDLDEVSLDAAAYCMKFIGRGVRPKKLSSYCFLRVRYILDSPKRQWYENNVELMPQDNYKDTDMEIEDENGCY